MHRILIALGGLIGLALGTASRAAELVYFEENGGGSNPRGLYNFDSATGQSTLRTTVGGSLRFFSLARRASDGAVFGVHPATSELYTVNLDTGQVTFVAATGLDTIANITFQPGTNQMFGLGRNTSNLYRIDAGTGQSVLVGNCAPVRSGLEFSPSGVLYGCEVAGGTLYTIDPNTGIPTLVGGSGPSISLVEDAAFTPAGELFLTDFDGEIYQVNPATGARSLVGNSGMGSGLLGILAAPPGACPGDINGDRRVDQQDLGILLGNWMQNVPPNTRGDLNGDGRVDQQDLGILLANWLRTCT